MSTLVKTQLQWNGDEILSELKDRIEKGLERSGQTYTERLKEKISEWGSVLINAYKRKRIIHSEPGEPPLRQTGNLYESINYYTAISYNLGQTSELVIFTDVPYAIALELGGTIQVNQDEKDHTSVRLVNPLDNYPQNIAPRPVWIPLFEEMIDEFISYFIG